MNQKWRLLLWKYCSLRKSIGLGLLTGFVALFSVVNVMMGSSVGASQQEVLVQGEEERSLDSISQEAQRLLLEGTQLYQQGTKESVQKALQKWEKALPLLRKLGNKPGEAIVLTALAKVYDDLGENQKALLFYYQSLSLSREVEDKKIEATTLNNIGLVYNDLGEKQKALDYFNQSLDLSRQVGDKAIETANLNNIGAVYNDLGEKQKALKLYNQSLELSRQVEDKKVEAYTLNNIGAIYDDLGEKQKALEFYNQSLPVSKQLGDKKGEATTLNNIGAIYNDLGEKQKALEFYNKSLPLSKQLGDKKGEATTLNGIGAVYNDLGEKQKAQDYFNQSLELSRQIENKAVEATTLNNIGAVYNDLGEKQKARELYNQSLELSRQIGDKAGEGNALNNIGLIYNDLGEKQKALECLKESLPLLTQVEDKLREARTRHNMGAIYGDLGEKQQALEFLNKSLTLRRQVEDKEGEAITLNSIARIKLENGQLNEALTDIKQAIEIIENLRTQVISQELRTSFFAEWQFIYQNYIYILMELHRQNPNANHHITALEISERARARSLIELLAEANADIRKDIDPELLQQERQLIQRIGAKTQALHTSTLSNDEREKIKTEIRNTQIQLQQLETEIKNISPRYANLKYPDPLTISQIQEVVDKDTILLSYWLGGDRSYLWAVTPDSVTVHELPKAEDIATTIEEFLKYLKDRAEQDAGTGSVEIKAAKVSEMLLLPVADQLKNKRLAIVSDGIIQYIPFSVLPPPQTNPDLPYQPLIVNHEIVNLPSASTIYNQRKYPNQPAPKTIAVMADPVFNADDERVTNKNISQDDTTEQELKITVSLTRGTALEGQEWGRLKYTRQEADQILALAPDNQKMQVYDFAANLKNAQASEISEYRVVHLATHGFFNDELPENSGIVLSLVNKQGKEVEGYLTTPNVFNLNLPAELIVLSACETGLGKNVSGEGLVGLTRGLMYAGGERVMVSLWTVNDEGTSELMVKFYQKMWEEKLSPAAALRAAQLEMWNDGEVAFLWSPFVLQGEWRD
ncbi:MAG: tetratricopeptide repeat protein [Okeania sp. SIO3I5]|uniref:CHAT domain-containing protein n=1 Tax=Okeania sp. SIO3I5 TaxID=2607805 RepID=UPI0013B77F32|nr:CHAT domain-containing tetratricopeptide repeat protein [Okeania sp. SIO3I5]NEQ37224.1 tetratricopeptide repeat protein [Okeania sp. SIO3I5]